MTKVDLNDYWKQLAEGAEKERAERDRKARQGLQAIREKAEKEIKKKQAIIDIASENYCAEERRKREVIAEAEKKKAIEKAEEEAERKLGIKSEKTKKIDNAYKALLQNLNFDD